MSAIYYTPPIGPTGVGNDDYGERWGDALGNIGQVKKNGFTQENYRDTSHKLEFVDHNQTSIMTGEVQFDHDYALDTEVRMHVHNIPMANGSGNIYWTWQYYWATPGEVIPAVASWTSGTTTIAVAAADQYKHLVDTLFVTTPSGAAASSILLFDITRDSTNILDTYDANKDHGTNVSNLGILYVDAHYRKSSPGTATEWA